jgi:chorismate mutase
MAAAAAIPPGVFNEISVRSAIPFSWEERARKAVEYYQEEPLVANAINAWRTFALGDEITVNCDNHRVREEAQEAFYRLDLNRFVKDMVLQLLLKGDAIGYVMPAQGDADLARVICVNPVSVRLRFENDELVEAIQRPQNLDGTFADEILLDLDSLLHVKWNVPEYEARGNSMVLPAFEAIELLRDYRKAERAIARRWTTPLRFIQVGGAFNGTLITPDQTTLDKIKNELGKMDMRQGLVVPYYVKAETYGAEGIVLNTEAKVREVKEDILVALGMARSVVTGDGPNFATASVSMQKMVVQLKEIKQVARDILDWVFDQWLERKGYDDEVLVYQFSDLDLTAEVDQKRLLVDLYDRGLISKVSLQQKMGLSPDVEARERDGEEVVVDTNWSVDDLTKLVALDMLTVDEARERMGLTKKVADAKADAARTDVERIYARHDPKREVTR